MNANLRKLKQLSRPLLPVDLFPLEFRTSQGKKLQSTLVKSAYPELDPTSLTQTYADSKTGLELPLFAVFDLEGPARQEYRISTGAAPRTIGGLESFLPWSRVQASVRALNARSLTAHQWVSRVAVLCGIVMHLSCVAGLWFVHQNQLHPLLFLGLLFGALLSLTFGSIVVRTMWPLTQLRLVAEFDGLLPPRTRLIARGARADYEKLSLIVDQQGRWNSTLLPDPAPPDLDPLLVGSKQVDGVLRHFVLDTFDLTDSENYLAAEFSTTPE
jgi:hypothetical protein